MELHLPISWSHVRVASICGLPGKAVHIWCRRSSTWPAPTPSSCTDPRRSLLGGYIHNRGTTVFIPGGNTLIMSRKVTLIGPNSDRDIEGALRRRFPDLAQDNFGIWSGAFVVLSGGTSGTPWVVCSAGNSYSGR